MGSLSLPITMLKINGLESQALLGGELDIPSLL